MVRLPQARCIDSTEVTRAQYQAWLATSPSTGGQDSWCSWNTDYTPDTTHGNLTGCGSWVWPPATMGNQPVVCVDWCDAYAYCKAVGKRLCGKIGGGPNGYNDIANESLSQWYSACASDGTKYAYPYGNTYQPQSCNGLDKDVKTTVEVGTLPECQGSGQYAGVFDLSGNAYEWEDSCNGAFGDADLCRLRGGTVYSNSYDLRCGADHFHYRGDQTNAIGFRCCGP
jgi:formylglycine-generating enzyme